MKMLNVIDEFTRQALAIDVDRSIDADGVVAVLDRLALHHGAPHYVRFDNGPEFVAHAVRDWCRFNSAGSLFIDPGSPWQNAWIESFTGRLRDQLLNSWRFDSLLEARVIIDDWRCDYNANRPHSAHGQLTPTEFAPTVDHDTNPKSHRDGPPNGHAPHSRPAARVARVPADVASGDASTRVSVARQCLDESCGTSMH
jgi:transposase InsO family protein